MREETNTNATDPRASFCLVFFSVKYCNFYAREKQAEQKVPIFLLSAAFLVCLSKGIARLFFRMSTTRLLLHVLLSHTGLSSIPFVSQVSALIQRYFFCSFLSPSVPRRRG